MDRQPLSKNTEAIPQPSKTHFFIASPMTSAQMNVSIHNGTVQFSFALILSNCQDNVSVVLISRVVLWSGRAAAPIVHRPMPGRGGNPPCKIADNLLLPLQHRRIARLNGLRQAAAAHQPSPLYIQAPTGV